MKIDDQVDILQPRGTKRRTAGNVHQLGRAEAEQPVAVAEHAVEHAQATVAGTGFDQHR
ncbi:hypothetical protein D3C81_2165500 [compost metagenome]